MEHATTHVLAALRDRGYRASSAREHIVDVLARQAQPQSVQEIVRAVDSDEASVYRTIELLRTEGLIEEIFVAGERPRVALTHGHHHHVVCDSCGRIEHIPCEDVPPPKALPSTFVSIATHDLTFHGCCKNCS